MFLFLPRSSVRCFILPTSSPIHEAEIEVWETIFTFISCKSTLWYFLWFLFFKAYHNLLSWCHSYSLMVLNPPPSPLPSPASSALLRQPHPLPHISFPFQSQYLRELSPPLQQSKEPFPLVLFQWRAPKDSTVWNILPIGCPCLEWPAEGPAELQDLQGRQVCA